MRQTRTSKTPRDRKHPPDPSIHADDARLLAKQEEDEGPVPLRELLTSSVILAIANYCFLAFLGICLYTMFPLFYAMPIHLGGLGITPQTTGLLLGIYGVCLGALQAIALPRLVRRLGLKNTFLMAIRCFVPAFALFPVINLLARRYGTSTLVFSAAILQLLFTAVSDMVRASPVSSDRQKD